METRILTITTLTTTTKDVQVHVFFAINNIDFQEDTYDGSNTLHGISMAIYQKCQADDEKPQLR